MTDPAPKDGERARSSATVQRGLASIELLTRVASMYYLEDMTQETIASQLGLSRPKVWRLLTQAKEAGIVQITVNLHPSLAVPVETEMTSRFGLSRTILVVDQGDDDSARMQAGREVVALLDRTVRDGSVVTVGMGRSLRAVALAAEGIRPRQCTIVSAIGGSASIGEGLNSNDIATRLAAGLGGTSLGIYAPAYAESPEVRDAFLRHDDVRRTVDRARSADLAVVGIGDADETSLVVGLGLITAGDMDRMRTDGAVGDVLGSFLTVTGEPVGSWIGQRVVGLGAEDLRGIPSVIAVATEPSKAQAILGALNSGIVHTLVTSLAAARRVLELAGPAQ